MKTFPLDHDTTIFENKEKTTMNCPYTAKKTRKQEKTKELFLSLSLSHLGFENVLQGFLDISAEYGGEVPQNKVFLKCKCFVLDGKIDMVLTDQLLRTWNRFC